MSVTFEVSDVPKPDLAARRKTVAALEAIRTRLGSVAEASAANLEGLVATKVHPFVHAAHLAFEHHVALSISPDDVWLCIAQAFAHHIDTHAEELRDRFVQHAGKAEIIVIRDEFVRGSPDNDWPGVFGEFSNAIARHIGKQRDLVVATFSTTGPVERAASEVVLMSAMQKYFKYIVLTRCGIPQITLLGTPDDWRSIQQRAAVLAEYGLESWVRELSPILDQLCEAAARTSGPRDVAIVLQIQVRLRRQSSDRLDQRAVPVSPSPGQRRARTEPARAIVAQWLRSGADGVSERSVDRAVHLGVFSHEASDGIRRRLCRGLAGSRNARCPPRDRLGGLRRRRLDSSPRNESSYPRWMKALALAVMVGCSGSHEAVSVDAPLAPSCTWSPAIELAEFGDGAVERDPTEPADLLELYYTSDASPGDILFARRASADTPFVMQPLPSFVTEGAIDMSPAISADGLRLMFVDDRGASAIVYETARATRSSPWSTPQSVLSGSVDVGAGITMSADGLRVFVQLIGYDVLVDFIRTTTDRPFAPDNNLISVMPSPAVDDSNTAIYYNCGVSVCMRPMQTTGVNSRVGDEQPVAMGTASGARDPWVEAGGSTVVFAAEHSLYRATKSCTP